MEPADLLERSSFVFLIDRRRRSGNETTAIHLSTDLEWEGKVLRHDAGTDFLETTASTLFTVRLLCIISFPMPDGYIPTLETKQRECWKLRDTWFHCEFDSMVNGQPSKSLLTVRRNQCHLLQSIGSPVVEDRRRLGSSKRDASTKYRIMSVRNSTVVFSIWKRR